MNKYIKLGVLFVSGLAVMDSAIAAEKGWYAGLGIAQTNVVHNQSNLSQNYPNTSHVETKNYGLKAFAGYWFDEYLAMEMNIQDVPQFSSKTNSSSTKLYGMNNYGISMLARKPVGEHEIFAKAGISMWSVCEAASCSTELEAGQSLTYGAGVNLNLYDSEDRVMRFEWEHTAIDSIYLDNMNVFSVNIVFNFHGSKQR